jgi:hypothetical protein
VNRWNSWTDLVADNLALGVVFKVTISLEPALDKLSEFGSKHVMVKQVMYSHSGSRRLGRVGWANTFLSSSDAIRGSVQLAGSAGHCVPFTTKFNLF